MNRFLICSAIVAVGTLALPAITQAAPPAKVTIAHIGDAEVTNERTVTDQDGIPIAIVYTITGYYNVIEVPDKAIPAHEEHHIQVMGAGFEDQIPYDGEGEKGDHFTVNKFIVQLLNSPFDI